MSPPVGERKRAKKPKSKNGCTTCKWRRVKCDEVKPECNRCFNYGIDCEGYQSVLITPHAAVEHVQEHEHSIHSQAAVQNELYTFARAWSQRPATLNSFGTLIFYTPFHSQEQNRYTLYFQEQTISRLCAPYEDSLFSTTSMQICYVEPALMCLISAIGAIDKSYHAPILETSIHHQNALTSFGQALTGIQKIINMPTFYTPRLVLLAALLIFCFENMQGDGQAARAHFKSALYLLHKQLPRRAIKYNHTSSVSPLPDVEQSIFASYARYDNELFSNPEKLQLSSTPETSPPIQGILNLEYSSNLLTPSTFTSLEQARVHLEAIQFFNLPAIVHNIHTRVRHVRTLADPETTDLCLAAFRHFQAWIRAFKPLYHRAMTGCKDGNRNPDPMAASIVLARGLTSIIVTQGFIPILSDSITGAPNQRVNDLKRNCREALSLVRTIADDPFFRRGFVFDCAVIPTLFMIVISPVDDIEINMEGQELMRGIVPRREGAWDSTALVKVGESFLESARSR